MKGLKMFAAMKKLFEEVDAIHEEHDIEHEASVKLKDAIKASYPAIVSEQLNSAIDDVIREKEPAMAKLKDENSSLELQVGSLNTVLQDIADALANSDVAKATQIAVSNCPHNPKASAEVAEKGKGEVA